MRDRGIHATASRPVIAAALRVLTVARRRALSVRASRARADALANLPILGEVASAIAEMWSALRQPNGDATRELCSRWQKNSGTK